MPKVEVDREKVRTAVRRLPQDSLIHILDRAIDLVAPSRLGKLIEDYIGIEEVQADGKIPHFTVDAVEAMIEVAQELSGVPGMITCRFRDLGGLIRASGDQAVMRKHELVTSEDVRIAKQLHIPIEDQMQIASQNLN